MKEAGWGPRLMAPKKSADRAPGAEGRGGKSARPHAVGRAQYLQREHKLLSEELDACKQRVDQVLQENDFLGSEAHCACARRTGSARATRARALPAQRQRHR